MTRAPAQAAVVWALSLPYSLPFTMPERGLSLVYTLGEGTDFSLVFRRPPFLPD